MNRNPIGRMAEQTQERRRAEAYATPDPLDDYPYTVTDLLFDALGGGDSRKIKHALAMGESGGYYDPPIDPAFFFGLGDFGVAGAVKYGPRVLERAVGEIPAFINRTNRMLGAPDLPFELNMTGYHYGRTAGLSELDPAFHGQGFKGAERAYTDYLPDEYKPTFFYVDEGKGIKPEGGVLSGAKAVYKAELGDDLYDMAADPHGLLKAAMDANRSPSAGNVMWSYAYPDFYKRVKDAGYKGFTGQSAIEGQGVAAVFGKTGVEQLPAGMGMSRYGVSMEDIKVLEQRAKDASDELLALPNPAKETIANQTKRQERWTALEAAAKNAGVKRQSSTGRYVGAGEDITSPQKLGGVVTQYVNRVKRALEAGIPRGYFYASGRKALSDVTKDVEHHKLMSELMQPTSTQVGPYENLNYAIRAHDQFRMGENVYSGIYPNSLRGSIQAALHDTKPFMGYKVDRYGNLLGPPDPSAHPMSMMPPNDMWEGYGTGLGKKKPPSGAPQVAFSDEVRERAMNRINKELVAKGEKPLSREEMQELHWLVIRAEDEGLPLAVGPKDTIQGSIPSYTAQHSWEAAPAPSSGININMPMDEYTDEVVKRILDETGKDRFVYAGGGDLQLPAVRGTGVYKGETNAGIQSRSLGSKTESEGLHPATLKRLDTTEAMRAYALGQEGRAAHMPLQSSSVKGARMYDIDAAGAPTDVQMKEIDRILNELKGPEGPNQFVAQTDNIATVFTDKGYRALDASGMKESGFGKRVASKERDLLNVTGGKMEGMDYGGIYGEYNWGKGGVTKDLLKVIDDPAYPNVRQLADNPNTRALMGDIANMYKDLQAQGKLTPNQKLVDVLDAWATSGLQGVRRLVDAGLAPAVVLGVFAGQQFDEQRGPAM